MFDINRTDGMWGKKRIIKAGKVTVLTGIRTQKSQCLIQKTW